MAQIETHTHVTVHPDPLEHPEYLAHGADQMAEVSAAARRCCAHGAAALGACGLVMLQDRASGAIDIRCGRSGCDDATVLQHAARVLRQNLEG